MGQLSCELPARVPIQPWPLVSCLTHSARKQSMAKDRNTFEKRQREMEKKRKADEKLKRRREKKQTDEADYVVQRHHDVGDEPEATA